MRSTLLPGNQHFNQEFLNFLNDSPTPFHAVAVMKSLLRQAGFGELKEADAWRLTPGGRYFLARNESSLLAFVHGRKPLAETGWRLLGAHTDSPCLKLKPQPDMLQKGYYQLGVEVYGGVLLNPWFDRDLSLAGRVNYLDNGGQLHAALVNFRRPLAVIPSLAIHLDREANEKRSINAQTDLPPLLLIADDAEESPDIRDLLLRELQENDAIDASEVLDFELSLFDTQPAQTIGLKGDFIAGARLDNLLSCFTGLQALLACDGEQHCVLVCNDHEEVGSQSAAGAQGPMLRDSLERIAGSSESMARAMARSMLISMDNAHGVHPNFVSRHDDNHGPLLNRGPVIKINANQRYASNSETAALFRQLCRQQDVPVQSFVVRSDMGCGSTIGPISAAGLGVRTLDVGVPTFAMHSIRELAGSQDAHSLYKVAAAFLALEAIPLS